MEICISTQTASICEELVILELVKEYLHKGYLNRKHIKRLYNALNELAGINTKSIILKEIKEKCK